MKKALLVVFGLFLLFLVGCAGVDLSKLSDADLQRLADKAIVCDEPYMRFGSGCCLDKDNNRICDVDEQKNSAPMSDTSVASIPNTNSVIVTKSKVVGQNTIKAETCGMKFFVDDDVRYSSGTLSFEVQNIDTQDSNALVQFIDDNGLRGEKQVFVPHFNFVKLEFFNSALISPTGLKLPLKIKITPVNEGGVSFCFENVLEKTVTEWWSH